MKKVLLGLVAAATLSTGAQAATVNYVLTDVAWQFSVNSASYFLVGKTTPSGTFGGSVNGGSATLNTVTNAVSINDVSWNGDQNGNTYYNKWDALTSLGAQASLARTDFTCTQTAGGFCNTDNQGYGAATLTNAVSNQSISITQNGNLLEVALQRRLTNTFGWQKYTLIFTQAPEVPVPAAAWLMGSGLVGLAGIARRRKQA